MSLKWWEYGLLVMAFGAGIMLMVGGCASQFGPMGMSPDQLAAWGKIKDQQAGCVKGVYAGVTVLNTWWNVDKGVTQGVVTIKDDCSIVFTPPTHK